ncbi:AbrB/MazE/SpoVT family DNA-binding domain-containing protein [Candidatus Woesearchaeota archaeon]|nr:AbrB/MazE/SpoVT family DNA-binding domain-containing protein [Candidatus Woesearchaeota archaeon]
MKKYPKLVQCDKRGQIVIPKDVRLDLGIEEGTGFFMYIVTDEGILLKKVQAPELSENKEILNEIYEKSDKIGITKNNLKKSEDDYKVDKKGGMDLI